MVLAEHRLERCLPAADRVISLVEGRIACDASPREHLAWAADAMPVLATPGRAACSRSPACPSAPPRSRRRAPGCCAAGVRDRATCAADPRRGRRPAAAACCAATTAPSRRSPLRGVWFEIEDGPSVLRGLDLELRPGERVALMGRNGAGKSTLLRLAKGLAEPTRGRIERAGEVALLLQNPGDYLIHEHAVDDAGVATAWRRPGLERPRARPTRATCPAASASGSRSRSCSPGGPARPCCSTSRPAGWTASTRTRSRGASGSSRRRARRS